MSEELEAGREIDALIAERVFGMPEPMWIPTHEKVAHAYLAATRPQWHAWPWEIRYWGEDRPIQWEPKAYSSDIGCAWKVVEAMGRTGWRFDATYDPEYGTGVTFERGDDNSPRPGGYEWHATGLNAAGDEFVTGTPNLLPLNICRAALAAMEAKNADQTTPITTNSEGNSPENPMTTPNLSEQ